MAISLDYDKIENRREAAGVLTDAELADLANVTPRTVNSIKNGNDASTRTARSIAEALGWFLNHPADMRAMGERGRQRILSEWNYERQFSPVFEQLNGQW